MNDPSINQAGGVGATSGLQITDNMDLDTIFMVLALDRSQTMDKVISDMAADMKATNDRINKLNDAMSVVRSIRPDKKADDSGKATLTAEQQEALKVLEEEGVAIPSALSVGGGPNSDGVKTLQPYLDDINKLEADLIANPSLAGRAAPAPTTEAKHRQWASTWSQGTYPTLEEVQKTKAEYQGYIDDAAVYTSFEGKPGAFDNLVENIKTKIDSLSSNSQLDMIKLQGMINKRNQVIEMASNVMQKIANSLNNLISNLR